MSLKLIVATALFAAVPALAHAQIGEPSANPPKPTTAEVQSVVQMITGDKAKLQIYCELGKLNDQIEQADERRDAKALQALDQKADALVQQLGPDYIKLMTALDQVDEDSPEGKEFAAAFDSLDKQCK